MLVSENMKFSVPTFESCVITLQMLKYIFSMFADDDNKAYSGMKTFFTVQLEAACSSETLVLLYLNARRHIPEHNNCRHQTSIQHTLNYMRTCCSQHLSLGGGKNNRNCVMPFVVRKLTFCHCYCYFDTRLFVLHFVCVPCHLTPTYFIIAFLPCEYVHK